MNPKKVFGIFNSGQSTLIEGVTTESENLEATVFAVMVQLNPGLSRSAVLTQEARPEGYFFVYTHLGGTKA